MHNGICIPYERVEPVLLHVYKRDHISLLHSTQYHQSVDNGKLTIFDCLSVIYSVSQSISRSVCLSVYLAITIFDDNLKSKENIFFSRNNNNNDTRKLFSVGDIDWVHSIGDN